MSSAAYSVRHFVSRYPIIPTFAALSTRAIMPPKRKQPAKNDASAVPAKRQSSLNAFIKSTPKEGAKPKVTGDAPVVDPKSPFDANALLIEPAWKAALQTEFSKPYFTEIGDFLTKEYAKNVQIFPPREKIFAALNLTPLDEIKVVVIGQDPYHDDGQAHGLCFSVEMGVKPPPSLKNMYKELTTDIDGFTAPSHGNLTKWAQQGVLLLNATLTVQAHKANSHAGIGWQTFTDEVIKLVSAKCTGVVFILWGGFAQKKDKLIDAKRHTIIKAAHPSPLSVTKFLGCKCFSKTNQALESYGTTPIDWKL